MASYSRVIGIDGSRLTIGERTGTETYSHHLLSALADQAIAEPVRVYLNARLPTPSLPSSFDPIFMPFPRFWTHGRLSWEMARRSPGVLFVPAHVVPLIHPPTVVTIHDLGYLYEQGAHPPAQRRMLDWTTRWSCRAARILIAISEATKRDLRSFYGVPEDRIAVIPHGVDPRFHSIDAPRIEQVRARHGLPAHYILAVGTIQPRKNLGRLLRALQWVKDAGLPHSLVVAGKRGWLAEQVDQELSATGMMDRLKIVGYVPLEELPAVYAGADVVCFPSLYEGFGLPALEAMAVGTPLLVSDRGALPEVVADAAIIIDPLNVQEMGQSLVRLLVDEGLGADLVARGKKRAKHFTWDRTARATLAVLRAARDEEPPVPTT